MSIIKGRLNYIYLAFFIGIAIAVFLAVYVFLNSTCNNENIYYPPRQNLTTIDNVNLISSTSKVEMTSLPCKKTPENIYSYNFIVNKNTDNNLQYIGFFSLYNSYNIHYKDELLYEYKVDDNFVVSSMGRSFHLLPISKNYLDKELEIEFKSNLHSSRKIKIPELYIGNKTEILRYFVKKSLFKFIAACFLLVTSLFLFFISIFLFKIKQAFLNATIAVLFAFDIGIYILLRAPIVYYYLNNSILIYFSEYSFFILMPLPICLLFLNIFNQYEHYDWRTNLLKSMIILILTNLVAQWILTLSGVSEFVLMQPLSFTISVISTTTIFATVISLKKSNFPYKNYYVFSLTPITLSLLIGLYAYFKNYTLEFTFFIIVSIIFFLFTHFLIVVKRYVEQMNINIEKEFYQKLAYIDSLTGVANRHALIREIENIKIKIKNFNCIHCIVLDANDFKKINDNFGHKIGDQYIQAIAQILNDIEQKFSSTKTFRFGGDEFIILTYNKNENEILTINDYITEKAHAYKNENCNYTLNLAIGYDCYYAKAERTIDAVLKSADSNMYTNKMNYKKQVHND